ncbi:DNA ligase [Paenibacillus sp. P96]|uniref:DNA ligase n=1 Tax=Paenibacillus zeirhizosphaerae TaxID=2987519 RepID=A0ABT9FS42_9BACL|nr:DNA ligase [Paenibacillus sp. P96]MDP4097563.1 DNA ligase [Paenibacillus sp. P96]
MNIGSVIRGLLGDAKAGESKKLELQTGQVVRGTVVKVSEDGGEAVLQIQGTQVRAKVETPLQEGQMALLQVQPPNDDGTVVLKPLSQGANQPISTVAIAEVLQSVKLPDTSQNRELIQLMQRSGIPLTAENAELLREAVDYLLPSGAKPETIVQAAAVAFQRGLPITAEAVAGLHQAIFGPPLDQLLSSLEKLVEQTLKQGIRGGSDLAGAATGSPASEVNAKTAVLPNSANASGMSGSGSAAAKTGNIGAVPAQWMGNGAAARQGEGAGAAEARGSGGMANVNHAELEAPGAQGRSGAAASPLNGGAPATAGKDRADGARLPTGRGTFSTAVVAGEMTEAVAADRNKPAGVPLPAGGAAAAATPQEDALPKLRTLLQELRSIAAQQADPVPDNGPGEGQAPAVTHREDPWVGRVLKLLGAEHEQQALRAAAGLAPARVELPTGAASAAQTAAQVDDATVKGLLLQLMDSSSVPPALKEAAQQVVQHLTGQQLLLNTDRTAPFAQVHMFIPFVGPDGQETASVQIQSRRGKRGELDSSNCRLWFDLDMKALGTTMVDVQVVNRIVSVKVHNNSEWTESLLDSTRETIIESLAGIGYQLLTLKAEPLPVRVQAESGTAAHIVGDYSPQVYKGVDIKV